jgi:hypothetical protein
LGRTPAVLVSDPLCREKRFWKFPQKGVKFKTCKIRVKSLDILQTSDTGSETETGAEYQNWGGISSLLMDGERSQRYTKGITASTSTAIVVAVNNVMLFSLLYPCFNDYC